MALPSFSMLALYAHMLYKTSKSTSASAESRAKMRGKMTRMVGTACLVLILCLAPSQTNYALAMAGKVRMDTKLHHALSLLVFISSCVNPFIYGLSNRNYRVGFQRLVCQKCNRVTQTTRKLMNRKIGSEVNKSEEGSYLEEHKFGGATDNYKLEECHTRAITNGRENKSNIVDRYLPCSMEYSLTRHYSV